VTLLLRAAAYDFGPRHSAISRYAHATISARGSWVVEGPCETIRRRGFMRKMMIAVAAAIALGTATMATGAMAQRGGHGGGGGAHFGGGGGMHMGGGGMHFGGGPHFGGGGHFAFRGHRGFGGLYSYGGWPYYGDGYSSCYVATPYGWVWVCDY